MDTPCLFDERYLQLETHSTCSLTTGWRLGCCSAASVALFVGGNSQTCIESFSEGDLTAGWRLGLLRRSFCLACRDARGRGANQRGPSLPSAAAVGG